MIFYTMSKRRKISNLSLSSLQGGLSSPFPPFNPFFVKSFYFNKPQTNDKYMAKKALTIIELIFVVIIIGIISAVATTMMRDDNLALATYQTLDHIRYTQHLAISEHKFDPKDHYYINYQPGSNGSEKGKFFRAWWQIRFQNVPPTEYSGGWVGYSIYSDNDREGNIDGSAANPTHIEAAVNPIDGMLLHNYSNCLRCSSDSNLNGKYGVANITLSGGCVVAGFTRVTNGNLGAIAFDDKGRPYYGIADNNQNNPYQYILTSDCNITLAHSDGRQAVITIHPETGYAEITRLD